MGMFSQFKYIFPMQDQNMKPNIKGQDQVWIIESYCSSCLADKVRLIIFLFPGGVYFIRSYV